VDDVDAARAAVAREGLRVLGGRGQSFDFRDPWGNRFQVVGYPNIQFERTPGVRRKLGIEDVGKTDAARREISDRGLQ
jgi:lactoylglutathione lyase